MEEQFDLEALYLYPSSWGSFNVGKIAKINDKTIRMENGNKIPKERFKEIYKLSEAEIRSFNGELVKKLSFCTSKVSESLNIIRNLRSSLEMNEFVCINTEKLQEKLDILNEELEKELPKIIDMGNKKYKFMNFSEKLEVVE